MSGKTTDEGESVSADTAAQKQKPSPAMDTMPHQPSDAFLTQESRDLIGRKLRESYNQRLSEPVPDRFAELLATLAKKG